MDSERWRRRDYSDDSARWPNGLLLRHCRQMMRPERRYDPIPAELGEAIRSGRMRCQAVDELEDRRSNAHRHSLLLVRGMLSRLCVQVSYGYTLTMQPFVYFNSSIRIEGQLDRLPEYKPVLINWNFTIVFNRFWYVHGHRWTESENTILINRLASYDKMRPYRSRCDRVLKYRCRRVTHTDRPAIQNEFFHRSG